MTSPPKRPIITLTTDFGASDHYVAAMKGVILTRCPAAQLVDVTHDIPPYGILAGAYAIHQSASWFPRGTVHLAIVDPGVGTARRGILVDAGGQFFVAPDNGLLSFILRGHPEAHVYELTNRRFWLAPVSATFHGRDLFAPVAAALASGAAKRNDVGKRFREPLVLSNLAPEAKGRHSWTGLVLSIDRFGNVITNFPQADFSFVATSGFSVQAGRRRVDAFKRTFGDARSGHLFAYFGSSGFLEIGLNQQSAASAMQVEPGAPLLLRRTPRAASRKTARA